MAPQGRVGEGLCRAGIFTPEQQQHFAGRGFCLIGRAAEQKARERAERAERELEELRKKHPAQQQPSADDDLSDEDIENVAAWFNSIKVTAVFGWPNIPVTVTQATILQSSRIFSRLQSPLGVAGFGDMGIMRVSRGLDPDVVQLVEGYRRVNGVA